MIIIERIFDGELIKSTLTHKDVYKHISDDSSPLASEFQPILDDRFYYLGCYNAKKEYLGLFLLVPTTCIWYDFHTCLLPNAWGISSICAKAAVSWFFENTDCFRITTMIPENNKLALRLAKKVGATQYGFNPDCWKKDGKISGVYLYGLSKGEICQQQYL